MFFRLPFSTIIGFIFSAFILCNSFQLEAHGRGAHGGGHGGRRGGGKSRGHHNHSHHHHDHDHDHHDHDHHDHHHYHDYHRYDHDRHDRYYRHDNFRRRRFDNDYGWGGGYGYGWGDYDGYGYGQNSAAILDYLEDVNDVNYGPPVNRNGKSVSGGGSDDGEGADGSNFRYYETFSINESAAQQNSVEQFNHGQPCSEKRGVFFNR